jgi:hypothetical protein
VVTVHDVVEAPALCAYAMEWVEGRSLASMLEAVPGAGAGTDADAKAVRRPLRCSSAASRCRSRARSAPCTTKGSCTAT